jgi:hypothetical protein
MNPKRWLFYIITLATVLCTAAACCEPSPGPADGKLADDTVATLNSLEKVDDYPLYTMHYVGGYDRYRAGMDPGDRAWACSLFAAMGDLDDMQYGRNFDWEFSPALLLFTDPPDGYASVSMVDIAYLIDRDQVMSLTDLPLEAREPLLAAPFWPFDGMNEHGLVVGMAAVPGSEMPNDPSKETLDSLTIIREMLDHARDVDEAMAIMEKYNIDWGGGPPLHYLVADASGHAVLVEFHAGEMVLLPNDGPYHLATNHLRCTSTGSGGCWRYAALDERLAETEGRLMPQDAIDLLGDVAQESTQWSIVYGISTGDVHVAMGLNYDDVHTFHLDR